MSSGKSTKTNISREELEYKELIQRIADYRKNQTEFSQSDIAKKIGISQESYSAGESGRSTFHYSRLKKICRAMGLDFSTLEKEVSVDIGVQFFGDNLPEKVEESFEVISVKDLTQTNVLVQKLSANFFESQERIAQLEEMLRESNKNNKEIKEEMKLIRKLLEERDK